MERERIQSNYEKCCEEWSGKIAAMDADELQKKLSELRREGEYLTIRHFGRKYGIRMEDGAILALEGSQPVFSNTKLDIYTLLWYSRPGACQSGEWVTFGQLKNARPFAPAFQKGTIQAYAATFSGHCEELRAAYRALGGRQIPHSDAGFEIEAFECIPMRYLFWDGDDEFPAQANILFDKNVVDFIHVESTVTIAMEGLYRLAEAAGLPVLGSAFRVE